MAALAVGLALSLMAAGCGRNNVRAGDPSNPAVSPPARPSPAASPAPSPPVAATPGSPTTAPTQLACVTATATQDNGSVAASLGDVSARLSWVHQGGPGTGYMSGAKMTLTRAGATLLDVPVVPPAPVNNGGSEWAAGWEDLGGVCVELPATGLPSVDLVGYAGAMTCCGMVRTYYPGPDGSYRTLDRSLGRGPGSWIQVSGQVVLMASNPDFNVKFDCGACSPGPLQAWTVQDGRYIDVTAQFPDRIAAEAAGWWKSIDGANPAPLGLVAPWVADECELGRQDSAYATLDQLDAAGKLVIPNDGVPPTWPEGPAFVSALTSFLVTEGYCH